MPIRNQTAKPVLLCQTSCPAVFSREKGISVWTRLPCRRTRSVNVGVRFPDSRKPSLSSPSLTPYPGHKARLQLITTMSYGGSKQHSQQTHKEMLPSQNNLQRHTYCWDALKECVLQEKTNIRLCIFPLMLRDFHIVCRLRLTSPRRRHTWTIAHTLHAPLAISLPDTLLVPSHSPTVNCINILLSALLGFRN